MDNNVKNSDPNWKKFFGKRFQKFREAIGFTQQELAQFLGYKRSLTICRWESGTRFPDSKILSILANKFRLNVNWLLTGKGPMFLEEREGEESTLAAFLEWFREKWEASPPRERLKLEARLEVCFPEFEAWLREKGSGK